MLIHTFGQQGKKDMVGQLEIHRVLVRLCREKGIEAGFQELLAARRSSGRGLNDEELNQILSNTAAVLGPAAGHKDEWRGALTALQSQAQEAGDGDTAGFAGALVRLLDEGKQAAGRITPDVPAAYRDAWDALVEHLKGD
jgi:hypothetical protein